jgi:hypothetical protein
MKVEGDRHFSPTQDRPKEPQRLGEMADRDVGLRLV